MHLVPRGVLAPYLRLYSPPHLTGLLAIRKIHDVRAGDALRRTRVADRLAMPTRLAGRSRYTCERPIKYLEAEV